MQNSRFEDDPLVDELEETINRLLGGLSPQTQSISSMIIKDDALSTESRLLAKSQKEYLRFSELLDNTLVEDAETTAPNKCLVELDSAATLLDELAARLYSRTVDEQIDKY